MRPHTDPAFLRGLIYALMLMAAVVLVIIIMLM